MSDYVRYSMLVRLLVLAVMLSACSAPVRYTTSPPSLATPDYVPKASYHLSMGEIAMQSGDYYVAAQEYLAAARLADDIEIAQLSTEYAYNYGFVAYFLESAVRWLELDPDNPAVHGYLGVAYLRLNDAKKAFVHFERSMPPIAERSEGDYLVLESEIAAIGDADAVVDVMQLFQQSFPSQPGVELALASAAVRAGDGALALENADAVLAVEPSLQRAQIVRLRGLLLLGRADEALAEMRALIAANRSIELELEYARLLASSDAVDAALQYLDDMAERYGFMPEIVRLSAIINMDDGNQLGAWNDFSKLLSAGLYTNESHFYLARMSEGSRQILPALRYYSQVRSGPLLLPAQVSIAGLLGEIGDVDAGIAHLDEVYSQFPQLGFDIWAAKAGIYSLYWRAAEAYEAYNRSLEYQPANINLMLARAAALDSMGETDLAVSAFREALVLDPGNANGMNSLGYTMANRNLRLREAHKLISKALAQQSDNPAFLDSMGWVLFREGDNQAALVQIERAYAIEADPEIAAHLGEVLWTLGRDGEANIVWALALQDSPSHMVLRETIERHKS